MKSIIAWFARNGVAANLLLLVIIAGGLLTLPSIKREVFPDIDLDIVTVAVVYPGAAPEEVEEAICIRIEEALQGLDGVKRITSSAAEGAGAVSVELLPGTDAGEALDDVKVRVDAIDTFPEEAEKPVIQKAILRNAVLDVVVYGEVDEHTLKRLTQRVRDEIAALPGISQAEVENARPYEISIEVSERALRRHGLTFSQVADAVRRGSLDLPGGSVKTEGGEILLRTKGQAYRGREFERIALLSTPDGTRLMLGDVARVVDGFEDTDTSAYFDGKPALLIRVFRVGSENALHIADSVREYVRRAQATMPEGVLLTTWLDESRILRSRLDTLLRNGRDGFLLVWVALALFLRFRLAFWVLLGVPLSFLGALWLMPTLGLSINVISLFAFIVVLGILVDDAIVVGENVHSHYERTGSRLQAAIEGTQEVFVPVVFGVLTTVAAFVPMLLIPGNMGKVFRVIPLVVIACLLFSLLEAMLVLPEHLTHGEDRPPRGWIGRGWKTVQGTVAEGLRGFIEGIYRPLLHSALEWRYLTVAVGAVAFLLSVSLVGSGWLQFTFFPKVEGDNVVAMLTMPQGTPVDVTTAAVRHIEAAAQEVLAEVEAEGHGEVMQHVLSSVGTQSHRRHRARSTREVLNATAGAHLAEVNIELRPSEERSVSSEEIARRWRERTGMIADAVELTFVATLFSSGEPIDVQLEGPSFAELREAAEVVKQRLASYPGVLDIRDSFRSGKQEISLRLRSGAENLGLSVSDLGRQVRQAFYGEEAQRIQRGRDEVKVMVRYPVDERRSIAGLESMRVRTADGMEVPFRSVADLRIGRGFSTVYRTDGRRVVNVIADIDPTIANANEIVADLKESLLPSLTERYQQMGYSLEGEQREQHESLEGLERGFVLALFLIYALLAVPLKSYVQPLIIMSAIPFGFVGAIWGHILMGYDISIFSAIGVVALSGVVVNDSLVLVDFVNRKREQGMPTLVAIREAGAQRFRPILLTTLTTFAGLTPLLLERSLQAQFLIPMAISLAFGVLFATFVSLVMVPSLYAILEDVRALSLGGAEASPGAHSSVQS